MGGAGTAAQQTLRGGRSAAEALRQISSVSEGRQRSRHVWWKRGIISLPKIAMLDLAKFCFTMGSSGF